MPLIRLPRWHSGKESTHNAGDGKRCGFDPWVGKIPWSRKQQLTLILGTGKFHGQRSLAGYSPWSRKRVRHNWTHTLPDWYALPQGYSVSGLLIFWTRSFSSMLCLVGWKMFTASMVSIHPSPGWQPKMSQNIVQCVPRGKITPDRNQCEFNNVNIFF